MVARLRSFLFRRKIAKWVRQGVIDGKSVFLPGFDIRSPRTKSDQIRIGTHCVISCQLILEQLDAGKIEIGDRCHIGGHSKLISIDGITIGNDVTIAWDCTIYDHDSHPLAWGDRKNDTLQEFEDFGRHGDPIANKDWSNVRSAPIVIEDKAWLGFGVTVLKGVRIGEGSVIGAMSVVTRHVPAWTVAVGNPARIVRELPKPEGGNL